MGVEKCQKCQMPFYITEHKLQMPGTKEKEPIVCPYCGHTIERMCNGWWNTSKLTEEEIADYLTKNK